MAQACNPAVTDCLRLPQHEVAASCLGSQQIKGRLLFVDSDLDFSVPATPLV